MLTERSYKYKHNNKEQLDPLRSINLNLKASSGALNSLTYAFCSRLPPSRVLRGRTEVRVGLQVSLHGVDEVPAGQEDEHGAGHLQRLDVPQQSLHQLEGRLLLVDLSHRALRLRRVLRPADHVTVRLQGIKQLSDLSLYIRTDSDLITVASEEKAAHILLSSLLVFILLLAVRWWRDEVRHLDAVLQEILCKIQQVFLMQRLFSCCGRAA